MKYKNKVPLHIRRYCEWELRHYRENKRKLKEVEDSMMPLITTKWSEAGGGSGVSNPTERTALKLATNTYLLQMGKTVEAIDRCYEQLEDADKKLVELVYFQNRFTIFGAAQEVGYSQTAAYKKLNDFIYLLACELGIMNLE